MALNQEQTNVDLLAKAVAADVKKIMLDLPVTVKGFGAKGDGIANDTQAFIDAFKSNRTVTIPATSAYYKVDKQIVIANINKLRINGDVAKILNSDLTKATWLFDSCTDLDLNGGYWGYVATPSANGNNSQHVMQFNQCQRVMVDKAHVYNSSEMGIAISGCYDVTVQNSTIENCFRDGTYSAHSAKIRYIKNTYRNIKDDAMSFHDYGHSADRTLISSLGYSQAADFVAEGCTVENAYQGFASVAGSGISIKGCTFKNTVLAGVALMNQKALYPDGTSRLSDATVESNSFYNCCNTTMINGQSYTNGGQGSTGRAAIMIVSLGDGNSISLTEPKRQSNVRIKNNFVYSCGALGMGCYNTDGLTISGNTYQNCTVSGNTLGGNVVEIWECTKYVEEGVNTVIDNRPTVLHGRGYSFSGLYGTMNDWVVVGRTIEDGTIANSPQLVSLSAANLFSTQLKAGSATQNADGSANAFAFPHGMGAQPSFVSAQGNRENAKLDGVVCDASSIVVIYKTPPTAGNITWYWQAKR